MTYLKVKWIHALCHRPVLIYSELDDEHWELRKVEILPDGRIGYANALTYTQQVPDYSAWVGSWYGYRKYWHDGKPTGSRMPDWNRYKY
ncbi:DUF6881 domain-containing protein [Bradyrhizobium septentrionale]|uniref:DUF6881 domain-containing protein n=1 Tax=Bradyrhizobium septentrionale TaxID=1404411 RepID=UPI003B8A8BB6